MGLYGVIAHWVTQRTPEIGIRMALGAGRRQVLCMVLGQGIALVMLGTVIGLATAVGLTRFLASMLFHVSPTDTTSLLAVCTLLALVAAAASLIPALRATGIDPVTALRQD